MPMRLLTAVDTSIIFSIGLGLCDHPLVLSRLTFGAA